MGEYLVRYVNVLGVLVGALRSQIGALWIARAGGVCVNLD